MSTRLVETSILALTLAAVLSAACAKSSENPDATGTTGSARPRFPDRHGSFACRRQNDQRQHRFFQAKRYDLRVDRNRRRRCNGDAQGALDLPGGTGCERIHSDARTDRRRQNGVPHLEVGWMANRKVPARGLLERFIGCHEELPNRTIESGIRQTQHRLDTRGFMRRGRLLIGVGMAIIALFGYYASREVNPITGKTQSVALSQEQEVVLGLQSAPQMAQEFGGPDPDLSLQSDLEEIGRRLVREAKVANTPYRFQFKVLRDRQTVNAFALPGGPIFITRALLDRLENEAQLAGVLGHEVGHVIGRHSAEQIAKTQLGQGLVGAVGVATSDEHGTSQGAQQMAAFVAQMTLMKYGREHELESDALGVQIMSDAGYDPRALINVMTILAKGSGGGRQPEFFSTHPDPGNRQERIRHEIATKFPEGVPGRLTVGRHITLP